MKLLVLAQTPPPLHGQSVMVRTLLKGLPAHGIAVHHINLGLSRDAADIGRWRVGKFFAVLSAGARALIARFQHGCDTLYYVPAPGKRGALYRDWVLLLLCRPFFPRLVLHWHASGLSEWLVTRAHPIERWLTQRLLGQAQISLVLSAELRVDAEFFRARKIAVVPNGVDDPDSEPDIIRPHPLPTFHVLFLGLCCEEKGLFAAAEAVLAANLSSAANGESHSFSLRAAGAFPDENTAGRFNRLCAQNPGQLSYVGPVEGDAKARLFRDSDCLCLPTRYAAEGQPLVLLEALAYDLPIIATHWRGIASTLPAEAILVAPDDNTALLTALLKLRANPSPAGIFRAHYLAHFTVPQHLKILADALFSDHSADEPSEN